MTTLLRQATHPVLTDHVLVETWLLLRRRLHPGAADRFWEAIARSDASLEIVSQGDIATALDVQRGYADQDFSIVDCTSFVVMQRLGLRRVASFDDDFVVYRFGPNRSRAFEVIR